MNRVTAIISFLLRCRSCEIECPSCTRRADFESSYEAWGDFLDEELNGSPTALYGELDHDDTGNAWPRFLR